MLPESNLRSVIRMIAPQTFNGPYSRCVGFHHLVPTPGATPGAVHPQPLWGMGSRISGGRFTPPGSFETIYVAEDPITALAEVALVIWHPQAPPATLRTPPWVHIAIEGVLTSSLDLTDPTVQSALATTRQELTGEWRYTQALGGEASTQMLGRVCHDSAQFDSIRYFSSKNLPNGVCVAIFPDRLKPPSYIEVYDPYHNLAQRLP